MNEIEQSISVEGSAYERSVLRLRSDPTKAELVRQCYFDAPIEAARRFASSAEFAEVCRLLGLSQNNEGKRVLDVGSGNGIASFAFASKGCNVVALEPDPSDIVGRGAMTSLLQNLEMGSIQSIDSPIGKYQDSGGGFDIVYLRQVAHHFPVLEDGVAQCVDLLKPGGVLLMTREHVADTPEEVEAFRRQHALVSDGVLENACPTSCYREAMVRSGLVGIREWGAYESPINFYPAAPELVRKKAQKLISDQMGRLGDLAFRIIPAVKRWALHQLSVKDQTPGRLYTFWGVKGQ